ACRASAGVAPIPLLGGDEAPLQGSRRRGQGRQARNLVRALGAAERRPTDGARGLAEMIARQERSDSTGQRQRPSASSRRFQNPFVGRAKLLLSGFRSRKARQEPRPPGFETVSTPTSTEYRFPSPRSA